MKPLHTRRRFLQMSGAGAVAVTWGVSCTTPPPNLSNCPVTPIRGSWISVWWDDRRHFYWNETCRRFTSAQWQTAVKDVADLGMKYLVLLAIAKGGKAFYRTPLLPQLKTACEDPIEALLLEADRYGVRFFVSSD